MIPRRRHLVFLIATTLVPVALLAFLGGSIGAEFAAPDERSWIFAMAIVFGIALTVLIVAYRHQGGQSGVLRIEPDAIRWYDFLRRAWVVLPYDAIWAAHKEGRRRAEKLVFKGAPAGPSVVIGTVFLQPAGAADEAVAAVHARVGALPGGAQKLAGILDRQAVAERVRSARRIVTPAVAVLLGLVFVAEIAAGAITDPLRLVALGANSYPLVLDGDFFRLATANLLHASVLHVLFNVVALVSFGALLEPLLGAWRFLTVLLFSALVGAAGSVFLAHTVLGVGASTGIAGLLAVYVVILRRWPERFTNPPTRQTWISLALALLWPALLFKNIDHAAHLAGFLAGLALVYGETRKGELLELAGRRRKTYQVAGVLLVALFIAAAGTALLHLADPLRDLRFADLLLQEPSLDPFTENHLAWHIATSPQANPAQLTNALRGIEHALEKEPATEEYLDTRATVLYRMGRWEEAVQVEYELCAAHRTPFRLSQLARFEGALRKVRGPLTLGDGAKVLPTVELAPGPTVLLDLGEAQLPPGAKAHLVLAREGKTWALLMVEIGTARKDEPLRFPLSGQRPGPAPDQAVLALVDLRQPKEDAPVETRWEVQPIVPEVARLP